MKLSATERMLMQQLLPKESSRTMGRLIDDLAKQLVFNDDELGIVNYRIEDGVEKWTPKLFELVPEVDIKVGHILRKVMLKKLADWDKEEKLNRDFIPLFDRLEALEAKAETVADDVEDAHDVVAFKPKSRSAKARK